MRFICFVFIFMKIKSWSELTDIRLNRVRVNEVKLYLKSHGDKFPQNLGSINEEQGKRFYQDNKTMKERYQGVCVCVFVCLPLLFLGMEVRHER